MRLPAIALACMASLALAACTQAPAPTAEPATQPAPNSPPAPPPALAPNAPTTTAAPENTDWTLPGGIGPLTTNSELEARFGKANLHEEPLQGPTMEGFTALVAYPKQAQQRLEIILDALDKDAPIQALRIRGHDSRWHDAQGLQLGMTLDELVKRNGAPISFYGFGWEYGGSVQDWHGGRLASAHDSDIYRSITLVPRAGVAESALPQGDSDFRSDNTKWPALGQSLVVGEIAINWQSDAD